MIDVIVFCALLIGFAVIVAGAAEYILDRGAEDEKDRLIDEIIKDLERRESDEH
jgi:hypothetical protein